MELDAVTGHATNPSPMGLDAVTCHATNLSPMGLGAGSAPFLHRSGKNKYAIHAYTHGPVTGSGPSVKPLTHLLVASTPGLGS